ncbi:DivIVA domain-containing protein [Cryobacterium sp. SO2]|uniref:DivIVA domain-containing protein n=1 Tax=Cryobacterium sp. SO2 TaxID=1897060 RepID=UPI00223DA321|nr:DivIVA domain-containing protein [Cryobacterium sp. SO2]WEO75892.1 DivIVA domain-containing protein [Cryobacterium sp. SO2]
MSTTFPRTSKKTLGYNLKQVEEFLESTRQAYDDDEDAPTKLTAADIRHTAFAMHKGGYSPEHVDAALERLEDAFAARERDRAASAMGDQAWLDQARSTAQVLINRLGRPSGRRFSRTTVLSTGYNRADVDRFSAKLVKYFQDGHPVTVDDVRTAVFRPQRAGYREAQVDLVLDSVVDVMLAVR